MNRYLIDQAGSSDQETVLKAAFDWLLKCSNSELHIVFNNGDVRDRVVELAKDFNPNVMWQGLLDTIAERKAVTLEGDIKLTASLAFPRIMAPSNGACLVIWADTELLGKVEARVGAIGEICAVPWVLSDVKDWRAAHNPTLI